jgi:transposase
MIRAKDQRFDKGIRAAAREFHCSTHTVSKWVNRYHESGWAGLEEKSRAPHSCPHKTDPKDEALVLAQRRRTPGFGARRLKREFELKPSAGAIARIIRQHGLTRPRKRKHRVKKDLRAVKAQYAPLTHLQQDVKYLCDIPNYWPQMVRLGLPRFEYTLRCEKLGATFLGFANSVSVTYAELMAKFFLRHLQDYDIKLADVRIQTDCGSEFDGQAMRKTDRGFTYTIEHEFGAQHRRFRYNPNANADVESFHAHVETEFFDIERFSSLQDFWEKITVFQHYWNFARPNSYKFSKAPVQILKEADPNLSSKILLFGPLNLEALLDRQLSHHVPVLAACRFR